MSEGTITFKLVPADGKASIRESKVRVRAHFDYTATTDPYIPCKEAGLDFIKGDVLHIVSQDDAYWFVVIKCVYTGAFVINIYGLGGRHEERAIETCVRV